MKAGFDQPDLADIIGFVYDRGEQHKFSEADVPDGVRQIVHELNLKRAGPPSVA